MRDAARRAIRGASLLALVTACSTRAPNRRLPAEQLPEDRGYADRTVRVALPIAEPVISATRDFQWYAADGRTLLTGARGGEAWRIERDEARVRAVRSDGSVAIPWGRGLVARPSGAALITVNGHKYRGEIAIASGDSDVLVVNRVPLELYLRGVVAREMGDRSRAELAALEAQAVASRSFAIARLGPDSRAFDLRAGTQDQAYGGVDAETDLATEAVRATRGQVLLFGGRPVDAPFSSACGGSTALPSDAWGTTGASYLLQVSDRIPGSDRTWCDIAPQYEWTRTLAASPLNAALDRYLAAYASGTVPAHPGAARVVAIRERTASGRVSVLEIETDRGIYDVRGDKARYVLREAGGEILRSTYFSVAPEYGRDGHVARLTVRGRGNGHGVGMCQWGAIGRARAGQSYRNILRTYYPGTTVGLAPAQ